MLVSALYATIVSGTLSWKTKAMLNILHAMPIINQVHGGTIGKGHLTPTDQTMGRTWEARSQQSQRLLHPTDFFDRLRVVNTESSSTRANSNVVMVEVSSADTEPGTPLILQEFRLCHLSTFLPLERVPSEAVPNAASAFLAVRHFNERIDAVVPNLSNLTHNCNVRFTMEFVDSQYSPMGSAAPFITDVSNRPHSLKMPRPCSVIGPRISSSSMMLATLGGLSGIPVVSHRATSARLENVEQYRLFGRIVPPDSGAALAAVDYLRNVLGASHVACLYPRTGYGTAYATDFANAAARLPPPPDREAPALTVMLYSYEVQSAERDSETIRSAVRQIKDSGIRYVFCPLQSLTVKLVFQLAYEGGIVGPNYFWLLGDGGTVLTSDSFRLHLMEEGGLLRAMNGIGIILADSRSNPDFVNEFESSMADSPEGLALRKHFLSKMPPGVDRTKVARQLKALHLKSASIIYDAVMAMGIAACQKMDDGDGGTGGKQHVDFFSGEQLFQSFLKTEFRGATGTVRLSDTGSRDFRTMVYTITNIVVSNYTSTEDMTVAFDSTVVYEGIHRAVISTGSGDDGDDGNVVIELTWKPNAGRSFIYNDGSHTPPMALPPIKVDLNLIESGVLAVGLSFGFVAMALSLLFAVFAFVYRGSAVVRASQPEFLVMICIGTFIMGSAIVPMSFQEPMDRWLLDLSCMASIWLLCVGFAVAFSALLAKLLRINKIFSAGFQRLQVKPQDVMKPFVIILSANIIVLTVWTIVAPLEWRRWVDVGSQDRFGRYLESFGACGRPEYSAVMPFVMMLTVVNFGCLAFANVQAYQARKIQTEFSESRYIALCMACMFQGVVLGIPVLVAVMRVPWLFFLLRSGIVAFVCLVILLPIFVPKIVEHRNGRRSSSRRGAQVKLSTRVTNWRTQNTDSRYSSTMSSSRTFLSFSSWRRQSYSALSGMRARSAPSLQRFRSGAGTLSSSWRALTPNLSSRLLQFAVRRRRSEPNDPLSQSKASFATQTRFYSRSAPQRNATSHDDCPSERSPMAREICTHKDDKVQTQVGDVQIQDTFVSSPPNHLSYHVSGTFRCSLIEEESHTSTDDVKTLKEGCEQMQVPLARLLAEEDASYFRLLATNKVLKEDASQLRTNHK